MFKFHADLVYLYLLYAGKSMFAFYFVLYFVLLLCCHALCTLIVVFFVEYAIYY